MIVLILWVLCAALGGAITNSKGRGWGIGVILGLLLAIIGVVITLFLSDKRKQLDDQDARAQLEERASMYRECPHCKEDMRRDASVCPHCRSETSAWTYHGGSWWHQSDDGAWWFLDEAANEWKKNEPEVETHQAQQLSVPVVSAAVTAHRQLDAGRTENVEMKRSDVSAPPLKYEIEREVQAE